MFGFFKKMFSSNKEKKVSKTIKKTIKKQEPVKSAKELEKEKLQQKVELLKKADTRMEAILEVIKKQNTTWFVHMIKEEVKKEKESERLQKRALEIKKNLD
jgi:superfamily II DNA helicase RecQ